jgi:DNA ligase-associated metallophosphoesterase
MILTGTVNITIRNQELMLLPQKALFWPDKRYLILSDIHLGKTGHFRKSGIAAPGKANLKNLDRLSKLIDDSQPEKILILGDLYHSSANREWFQFEEWRKTFSELDILLISGNHDQLHRSFYKSVNIEVTDRLVLSDFVFVHDGTDLQEILNTTIISGHIHPGVKLKGKGKQRLRLPCFSISDHQVILPAFGEFTGLHIIQPDESRKIFPVAENSVIDLNNRTE